jgi:hypothetical protein
MARPRADEELQPSEEELRAMMPSVLDLQRLIQERLTRGVRPRDELGIISLTSCNNNSCN